MTPRHVLCFLLAACLDASSSAAEFGPQDHSGADWTLADGDVVWGEHSNVGRFEIPEGAAVRVREFDGVTTDTRGRLSLTANEIVILGTLDASGAGYTGGSGGGGAYCAQCVQGAPAGVAPYGRSMFAGERGFFLDGGRGGNADGPWGGLGGVLAGSTNTPASPGGYMASSANGDSTTGLETALGSGSGGGRGGRANNEGSGGGGGAGGRGGGEIRLVAGGRFEMGAFGRVAADGWLGGDGTDFDKLSEGGDVVPPQSGLGGEGEFIFPVVTAEDGQPGFGGAGGGILIDARAATQVLIAPGAMFSSRGGGGGYDNGGTVKIFTAAPFVLPGGSVVAAGRGYLSPSGETTTPTPSPTSTPTPTPTPSPTPTPVPELHLSNATGLAGETVTVSIRVYAHAPVFNFGTLIHFEEQHIEFVGFEGSEQTSQWALLQATEPGAGVVRPSGATSDTPTALASGDEAIRLKFKMLDSMGSILILDGPYVRFATGSTQAALGMNGSICTPTPTPGPHELWLTR